MKNKSLGKNKSSEKKRTLPNAKYAKFDNIYEKIKKEKSTIKGRPSKDSLVKLIIMGYKLLLADDSDDLELLSTYLKKKTGKVIRSGKNPYYPLVKFCFDGKLQINKNDKTKYGQALYYGARKGWTIKKLKTEITTSLSNVAKLGKRLIEKDFPETNPDNSYREGASLVKNNAIMGGFTLKQKCKHKKKYVTMIAYIEEDGLSVRVKEILDANITKNIITNMGKEYLKDID